MASVSDNFNRASLGSNWTADSGGWSIISSTYVQSDAATSAVSLMRYTGTAMDSANHYVQALRRDAPSAGHAGVTARQASSTATYYVADYEGEWSGSGGWRLQKVVSGSATTLDSGNPAGWGEQVTLRIDVDGTSISATLDAGQDLSATDSAITSGTYAGLSGGWEDAGEFDDFEAEDLAASVSIPIFIHHYRQQGIS